MNSGGTSSRCPVAMRQAGAALVVGLIFLLVMTIVGLTAVRFSVQQGRMATNFQLQSETFQAAEVALQGVLASYSSDPSHAILNGLIDQEETATHAFAAGSAQTSEAAITYQRSVFPNSSAKIGGPVSGHSWTIQGTSGNVSAGTSALHELRVIQMGASSESPN